MLGGGAMMHSSRKPDIMADAAHAILTKPSRECTGNFFIDEDLLRAEGVTDFEPYAVTPGAKMLPDFFLD
jgi:citronellol/citronellal dehydrogenase